MRKDGKYQESRVLLLALLTDSDHAAKLTCRSRDHMTTKAKKKKRLNTIYTPCQTNFRTERIDSLFGLASSYRSLGDCSTAIDYLEKTIAEYPESLEFQLFSPCAYTI